MASLPYELLAKILDEHANDLFTLHSCILVNRLWCTMALQHLWAKPFALLCSSPSRRHNQLVENLLTTFTECFTDADTLKSASPLHKKHSKKLPFDYSLYVKEICPGDIYSLAGQTSKQYCARKIVRLAIKYCANIETLSLASPNIIIDQIQFLVSIESLPRLRNVSLYYHSTDRIFNILSEVAHNLVSISVGTCWSGINTFDKKPTHGLQKLIQSQHQLKAFTIQNFKVKMGPLFKLLESRSNSLTSLVIECADIDCDNLNIESIKFHRLTSIYIKNCTILEGGLKAISKADSLLPRLQKLEFENTEWRSKSDQIPLQNKYRHQIINSGHIIFTREAVS